jgi:anaerobic selenocysteine-containing dehydrogenase
MPAFLTDYPPEKVAQITGIPEEDLRKAAALIGETRQWMSCWTMGLNQSTHGTWNTNALINLHLATGAILRPGTGPFSLTGQPNAMGGREMGYMGPGLPGQRATTSADDRAFVEQAWGIPGTLRTDTGNGTIALFEDMAAGKIKACWIICTNPVASVANRAKVIAGLQNCDLVITQDAFLDTETNRYAHIILPGALWSEAEGVMINSERNMTLMAQAVPRRVRPWPTGGSSRKSPAPWVTPTPSPMPMRRRCSRKSAGSITPRPATTCAAPATMPCAKRRSSGPARRAARIATPSATSPAFPPPPARRSSTPARICRPPRCPMSITR